MADKAQQPSEDELTLLRRQDAAAFTRLVRRSEPLVVGLCRVMGLRGADVEDAAAEAFAEVYRALPRYEGRSSIDTWTYRIASRVIWRIRTQRHKRQHVRYDDESRAGSGSTPGEAVQRRQDEDRIWSIVAQLEARQATAVELYYRRDCSIEEIAEMLGCPEGTVKTLLHRARAILREKLVDEVAS